MYLGELLVLDVTLRHVDYLGSYYDSNISLYFSQLDMDLTSCQLFFLNMTFRFKTCFVCDYFISSLWM